MPFQFYHLLLHSETEISHMLALDVMEITERMYVYFSSALRVEKIICKYTACEGKWLQSFLNGLQRELPMLHAVQTVLVIQPLSQQDPMDRRSN